RLPRGLHLGTSTWSFPGWAGLVWARPETPSRLARHGLPAYARHPLLGAAGIDRTYYEPLTVEDYAAYAAQVPDGFRFVVKAHEALTVARWPEHPRYGERRGRENPLFLDPVYAVESVVGPFAVGLGGKAGALVFQLAPQDLGVVERFVDELAAFLAALPKLGTGDGSGPFYAVELRNREVLGPRYAAALAAAGAVHCVNRHPRMPDVGVQARLTGALAAPAFLCRWMLHPSQAYETAQRRYEPYDKLLDPDPATRRALARLALAVTARGRPAYVIANNNAEGSSPLTLVELAKEVAAQAPARAPA
ncbi:MAG TPA: DUF72 domain-containing protein, partial [Thermoanaerobaculia bacterium]|nr:DUF72 domain-containing protein [Thermoanaerobaculia bacterium]